MSIRRSTLTTLLLSLVVPLAGATSAVAEEPLLAEAPPQVWLNGAFGRVLGTDPVTPAGAAPYAAPLNAWMRKAPWTLETDVAFEDLLEVAVVSGPLDGAAGAEGLSGGAKMFDGPDVSGLSVVVATLTTDPYGVSQHAWLVEVPDREGDEEALLDIPGPEALLVSALGRVAGSPGDGCYVYLCVTVGRPDPAASLTALPVGVGETLSLRLGDGSALAGWTGEMESLQHSSVDPLEAEAAFPLEPQVAPALAGLEVPHAGEWLLRLRADFDRERGWQWFSYRLLAE